MPLTPIKDQTAPETGDNVALIVLAAGAGTRMKSSIPKPLHKLAGVSMLDWVLDAGRAVNPTSTIVVVSPGMEQIGDDGRFQIAVQSPPLGTGDALRSAFTKVPDADWALVFFADHPLLTREIVTKLFKEAKTNGALVTVLTCELDDAASYGRIARDDQNRLVRIVEKINDDPELRKHGAEVNSGMMALNARWAVRAVEKLKPNPPKGEYYLTDLVELAIQEMGPTGAWPVATVRADPEVMKGINDRAQLAESESILRDRIRSRHMLNGVTFVSPKTTIIDDYVSIGMDTIVNPFSIMAGHTSIGSECQIGPNAILTNAKIGDRVIVRSSTISDSTVSSDSDVGPYSHLRNGTEIGTEVHIGNYAELKNARIESQAKVGHFSYIGDAQIGYGTNIGAGTVTANFDGQDKHQTVIGKNAFIGSGSMLVAPLSIGDDAIVGAGSVVTHDVAPGTKVVGVPARVIGKTRPNATNPTRIEKKDGD